MQLAWRGTRPDRPLAPWKVRFHSRGYARGRCTLDIALSSFVVGALTVALNGQAIAIFQRLAGPGGVPYQPGARGGTHRQLPPVIFPAALVNRGENVLTLLPARPERVSWTVTGELVDHPEGTARIRYDVIRLRVTHQPGDG
ncbi:MAG TPA: hypothetical protein VF755_13910 [Catenuloplanes sp.]